MDNIVFEQLKEGNGKHQLICFPYLGGYVTAFNELKNELNDSVEVWSAYPPGHGGLTSTLREDIDSLVDLYYEAFKKIKKDKCIIFGHSMGGIIAYFLMQRIALEDKDYKKSIVLVLSACNTPAEILTKKFSDLSDDELIQQVNSYGGLDEELINEKEFLEFLIKIFRADYKVLESAAYCDYKPLDVSTYIMWGDRDNISSASLVIKWMKYFDTTIHLIPIIDGKHMFIHDKAAVVARHLNHLFEQQSS